MNYKVIILLLFSIQISSCQNKINKEVLFLGEVTKENKYKVFMADSIAYVDKTILKNYDSKLDKEYIKLYSTEEFYNVLDSLGLYFMSEGNEPFWDLRLKGSMAIFTGVDGKEKKFQITTSFQNNNSSGTNFMFKSLNGELYGTILCDIDFNYIPQITKCNLWNTELGNDSYYVIYFSFEGITYKGCVRIGSNFYEE